MIGIPPQDLVNALLFSPAGGLDPASLQGAAAQWQSIATAMHTRLSGGDDSQSPSLLDHIVALDGPDNPNWSGDASASFRTKISSVHDYGTNVAGTLQPVPGGTSGPGTWVDVANHLTGAITTAQANAGLVTEAYNGWLQGVGTNLAAYDATAMAAPVVPFTTTPAVPPMVVPEVGGVDGYTITSPTKGLYVITTTTGEVAAGPSVMLDNAPALSVFLKTRYFSQQFDDILGNLATSFDLAGQSVPTPAPTNNLPAPNPGTAPAQTLPTDPAALLSDPRTVAAVVEGAAEIPSLLQSAESFVQSLTGLGSGMSGATLSGDNTSGLTPAGADTGTTLAGYNPNDPTSTLTAATGTTQPSTALNIPSPAGQPSGGANTPGLPGGALPGAGSAVGGVVGVGGLSAAGGSAWSSGPGTAGLNRAAGEEIGASGVIGGSSTGHARAASAESPAASETAASHRSPYFPMMSSGSAGHGFHDGHHRALPVEDDDLWGSRDGTAPAVLDGA